MESSGDCSVVRDCSGGPKAPLRLFNRRNHGRRPPRAGCDLGRTQHSDILTESAASI